MAKLAFLVVGLIVIGCSGSPAATPTAPPTPTATPGPDAIQPCVDEHQAGGRISLTTEQSLLGAPLSLAFPAGWTGCGLAFKGTRNGLPATMVGFWPLEFVYPDPCHWKSADRSVAMERTVGGAEAAQRSQAESGYVELNPAGGDFNVGGYGARHLQFRISLGADLGACDSSDELEFRFWDGPGNGDGAVWWVPARAAAGLIADVYFVDVDGELVAIQTVHFPDAAEGTDRELEAIVKSIAFEP